MLKTLLLLKILWITNLCFSGGLPQSETADPMWLKCKMDSDCVVAEDICHHATSYNKKFEPEILAYYEKMRPVTMCLMYEGPPLSTFQSRCHNNQCKLVQKLAN